MSFFVIATSLINLVGDYLFQTKADQEAARVVSLAVRFAPLMARGDAEALYQEALQAGQGLGGRLLVLDMDGKVQIDTYAAFNGTRIGHPEVVTVLSGASWDYGFHKLTLQTPVVSESRAFFDFLRNMRSNEMWVGYFAAAIEADSQRLGAVLYSVSVQDVVTNLRVMSDRMLAYFLMASLAVLGVSLVFSRIITRPIAMLTEGINRMARGDLSSRVTVGGRDEMGRLGETFNQMSEKLERLDTTRNEFVSNASHELKTPLATMKIMLESVLFEEQMEKDLQKEFLGDIDKEIDRLSAIVTDLLTLVQVDARDYQPSFAEISFRELVEETLGRLEPLAAEKEQELTFKAQSDCALMGDAVKMQQIVYNLVENAIKYTPAEGAVKVSLRQEGKKAVLEVADTGPGIPKADQPHIFDRFYRVDKARARATGGNGLGLAIVHQAVLLHGGSVAIRSEEGKGATFRVELPL